ncbi:hypothetical protein C4D60_Mb04t26240 [Musa balbisiana]|uniref:Uncharacterized protein n=1 Tax=Musa balbisiana TaxID=52838 RepID=A0A4S8KFC4_MUSBA|nr:hypothetical protein C4D60_Mb04t26240 [Musa balbisiana]
MSLQFFLIHQGPTLFTFGSCYKRCTLFLGTRINSDFPKSVLKEHILSPYVPLMVDYVVILLGASTIGRTRLGNSWLICSSVLAPQSKKVVEFFTCASPVDNRM